MLSSRYYSASRVGTDLKPRTAMIVDEEDELYGGFNEVSAALDTRALRDQRDTGATAAGRKATGRLATGTGVFRAGTASVRGGGASRAGSAAARPVTALRAAGYSSAARDAGPSRDDKREGTMEDKIKQMEARIMTLVEESCMLSDRPDSEEEAQTKREFDMGQALAKAQEASALERQLIRVQEQANLGDSHNLDLTFAVLCNLAGQYALNEMYTEALNTYQLLTRNKLFPHANRLKVNMGNIYFKMGEHPKALKLYRMALDQTPTAEKDLRMKVMHNIGLLLVRMGKFRDAVTNFQHIMHEQGDFQTGLHLVLCSVALNDEEGGKAAFHAMLDVEPPACHQDIAADDEDDPYESVLRDVLRGDRLSAWSRRAAAHAERCLALAAAALARPATAAGAGRDDDTSGMSWCVEALRGYGGGGGGGGGGAGARLELGGALAALRAQAVRAPGAAARAGGRALSRLKAVARAHHQDRVLRAEANTDAAFIAYALSNWSEASALGEAAARDDPYSAAARVCGALAAARAAGDGAGRPAGEAGEAWRRAAALLAEASHLDPSDLIAMHNHALALERTELGGESGAGAGASARWARVHAAGGAGGTLRALAAAGLARCARAAADLPAADHWYSTIGSWDAGVACALADLHGEMGDTLTAKHHYQDVEAAWPCCPAALRWLAGEARAAAPAAALPYYRRAARLQPNNVINIYEYLLSPLLAQWGLLAGGCLRASGRYQEALALYKRLNARFPDDVQCLKLIVKLCGDQGLSETSAWARELQRAQARAKQPERGSVTSAGSGSSGTSQSPIDHIRAGAEDSGRGSRHALRSSGAGGSGDPSSGEHLAPLSRPLQRAERKKLDDSADELPLPPV